MSNWLELHGYMTGWIGLLLTLRRDMRRVVRRALPALKRGGEAVTAYVLAKLLGYYIRFFVPKEEATKLVLCVIIGYVAMKVLQQMPKTSEQSPA